ncbi:hypothetical protein E3U43_012293 [Larimichthys crocea]|uniref:Uncharacterized protein n=1 Tax=Larimichthys crocea TaxID=215358 RepID=A0ACD3RTU0_LARCR|nr:hypothetical protein E3U43_012293 [Larimichthys crocea]
MIYCYIPLAVCQTNPSVMGKGESEEWDEKHPDTRQTQPQRHEDKDSDKSGSSCPKCCLRTRDCLMSGECGRALQISSVVAMCGMCIRMWMCKSHPEKQAAYVTASAVIFSRSDG